VCLYGSADSAASEPVFIMLCTKGRTQKGVSGLREGNTQIPGQQISVLSIEDTGSSRMKNLFNFENFTNKNSINLYDLKLNNKTFVMKNPLKMGTEFMEKPSEI